MMELNKAKELAPTVYKETMENGGFSYDTKNRYSVAYGNNEIVLDIEGMAINEIINKIATYLLLHGTVGTWLNEGKIYLDTSVTMNDLNKSLNFARINKQLAIYDLKENKEIFL